MKDAPKLPEVTLSPSERIEICIPSRGRTANLITLLQALRDQRFTRWDLTILDDNPDDSLKNNPSLEKILWLIEMNGHRTRIIRGESAGVIHAHNTLLMATKKKLIARIDDDTLPDHTGYLDALVNTMLSDKTGRLGAVGGPIVDVQSPLRQDHLVPPEKALKDYYPFELPHTRYIQPDNTPLHTVTVLYSSFLFKRAFVVAAGGYSRSYSIVAEKEETDILIRIGFLGAVCLFHPQAQLWHLKAPSGGTRSASETERATMFQSDFINFVDRMKRLKAGTFDWAEETRINLTPFERFTKIDDSAKGYVAIPADTDAKKKDNTGRS